MKPFHHEWMLPSTFHVRADGCAAVLRVSWLEQVNRQCASATVRAAGKRSLHSVGAEVNCGLLTCHVQCWIGFIRDNSNQVFTFHRKNRKKKLRKQRGEGTAGINKPQQRNSTRTNTTTTKKKRSRTNDNTESVAAAVVMIVVAMVC
jgi:hypothetical protein